jgi:hypothetical protein
MRQRMGKERFAMTARIRCASAQVARWCGFAVGAAILAFSLKPHAATFTYTNPACTSFTVSGSPPTQLVTCITSAGGGGGVPTCSPTVSPGATVAINTALTISANCSNQPTSYQWTGGGCGTNGATTSCTLAKDVAKTVLVTVNATNGSGTGSTAQISVTWK